MPTVALDKTKSYVISTLNSLPYALSMGEIKEAVANVSRNSPFNISGNYCHGIVEDAVLELVQAGKVVVTGHNQYISRRHLPKLRTLDADWQW